MAEASFKISKDYVPNLKKAIKQLLDKEVLVGVPEETTTRPPAPDEPSPPTNASIAYWQDRGAPAANIPARPFMIPGVEDEKEAITKLLGKAALAGLKGDPKGLEKFQIRAGQKAVDGMTARITEGIPPPLADSTVRRRLARHPSRKAEAEYLRRRAQGISAQALFAGRQTFFASAGLTPLIDTGELRRSLKFVIRKKKGK